MAAGSASLLTCSGGRWQGRLVRPRLAHLWNSNHEGSSKRLQVMARAYGQRKKPCHADVNRLRGDIKCSSMTQEWLPYGHSPDQNFKNGYPHVHPLPCHHNLRPPSPALPQSQKLHAAPPCCQPPPPRCCWMGPAAAQCPGWWVAPVTPAPRCDQCTTCSQAWLHHQGSLAAHATAA